MSPKSFRDNELASSVPSDASRRVIRQQPSFTVDGAKSFILKHLDLIRQFVRECTVEDAPPQDLGKTELLIK